MTRIDTALTRLLDIRFPIVQAGMSWASSTPALPVAVSNAGGLGVLAAGPMRLPDFNEALAEIRQSTDRAFGVNLPLYRRGAEDVISELLHHPVPVLIASQGGPRKHLAPFQAAGTRWLHVVSTVEHAVKAADAGVDGLVVVGGEAGGHPPADFVSSLVILRAVRNAVPHLPIVASGGFADGFGLAAAIALGADGAQFGTRFMATPEANVHANYKSRILDSGVADTVTVGEQLGVIRMLKNSFSDSMIAAERGGASVAERRLRFEASTLRDAAVLGDIERGKVEAGQSAGLITDVMPAAVLVSEIVDQFREAARSVYGASFLHS